MNPCSRTLLALLFAVTAAVQAQNVPQLLRFEFRENGRASYLLETNAASRFSEGTGKDSWIHGKSAEVSDQEVDVSSRIAIKMLPGKDVRQLLHGNQLTLIQSFNAETHVLQAEDAWDAVRIAERLAHHPDVTGCIPVMRRLSLRAHSAYSPQPNDPYFTNEFQLEQRNTNGAITGADLNVRAAWPITQGQGVVIGIGDEAVEVTHPDLASRANPSFHYNFIYDTTNLMLSPNDTHATYVAGLAVAELNNNIGVAGVAPGATFASWRIIATNGAVGADDSRARMFQYESNNVAVQNHSWGTSSRGLDPRDMLSDAAIDNAINFGRQGKGVVLVRSAGNFRGFAYTNALYTAHNANANFDGFCADRRVIVVGGVRPTGRVTYYSTPGANILVGALATESRANDTGTASTNFASLFTTSRGSTYSNFGPGTSGSAPQIAGLCSLILSANTNLTYRDVQQILVLSSRHIDTADPDICTNGAGLLVSHNVGFGVPDAGLAVRLAKMWSNRPAMTMVSSLDTTYKTIPDQGFLVRATGANVPTNLLSIAGLMALEEVHPDTPPGEMFRPDSPTASLPLVDVGSALTTIGQSLTNKGALILRGGDSFYNKIKRAEQAGASFAIIYNSPANGETLASWQITNFVSIPSILIGQTAGLSLSNQIKTNANLVAQLKLDPATYTFNVTNRLICEHIGVDVRTDNLRRSDIRVTLISPQGTRSVLQKVNKDPSTNATITWTYFSTHHFFESSAGTWTVNISDEVAGGTLGVVQQVELRVYGVSITDTDADGLADSWETSKFGSLAYGPKDDPDKDGYNNAREQILGSNPMLANDPLNLDFSKWNNQLARISWPANTNYTYDVKVGSVLTNLSVVTNIIGQFPEMDWFTPYSTSNRFIQVIAQPRPGF